MDFFVIFIPFCVTIIVDATPYPKRNPKLPTADEPQTPNSKDVPRLLGPQQPLVDYSGRQYNLQHAQDYIVKSRLQLLGSVWLQNDRNCNRSFPRHAGNPKNSEHYLKYSNRIKKTKQSFNRKSSSNTSWARSNLERKKYLRRRLKYNYNSKVVSSSLIKPVNKLGWHSISADKTSVPQVNQKDSRRPTVKSTSVKTDTFGKLSASQKKEKKREVARISKASGIKKSDQNFREKRSQTSFDLMYLLELLLIFIPVASIFTVFLPIASFYCGSCKKRKRGTTERNSGITVRPALLTEEHDNTAVDSSSCNNKDAHVNFVGSEFVGEGDSVGKKNKLERSMIKDHVPSRKQRIRICRNSNSVNMEFVAADEV